MQSYSKVLLRFSAVFAFLGAVLGSHMAGAGGLEFKTIHAHVLVVGWLSLFSWAVYYKVFTPSSHVLAALHVWSAIIGTVGLTSGMWLYYLRPFSLPETFVTVYFIAGGTVLLLSFLFFLILTFLRSTQEK
ncbi:hypothetical protein ACFOGI_15670 [Virgibacillus xinjiangensis]|uniref:Cytochrome c/quinol oxidase subunit I n=1 Tax=Virgibacillus xinjiangensis TaxID=393090 RepID=A0ABV7CZL0_9BACI